MHLFHKQLRAEVKARVHCFLNHILKHLIQGQIAKKTLFHRVFQLEWDEVIINTSQRLCLSRAHSHTLIFMDHLKANISVARDGGDGEALTDGGSPRCLLRLAVLCSGLASQFSSAEQRLRRWRGHAWWKREKKHTWTWGAPLQKYH